MAAEDRAPTTSPYVMWARESHELVYARDGRTPGKFLVYNLRKADYKSLVAIAHDTTKNKKLSRGYLSLALSLFGSDPTLRVCTVHHAYTSLAQGRTGLYSIETNEKILTTEELARAVEAEDEHRRARDAKERAMELGRAAAFHREDAYVRALRVLPATPADAEAAMAAALRQLVALGPTKEAADAAVDAALTVARAVPRG